MGVKDSEKRGPLQAWRWEDSKEALHWGNRYIFMPDPLKKGKARSLRYSFCLCAIKESSFWTEVQPHYVSLSHRPVWIPIPFTSNTVFMGKDGRVPNDRHTSF